MPRNKWMAPLVVMQADGTALANSTTETSILNSQAKYTLPGNFMEDIGQTLKVRASGRISNIVTTPGTLTFRMKFGSIIVATSGALALNTTAKTNVTWVLDWELTLRAVGGSTTANAMHTGQWQSESVIGSPAAGSGGAAAHIIPASAPAVGTGFDSTVSNVIDLTAQWSVANAGNSIQCHQYELYSCN